MGINKNIQEQFGKTLKAIRLERGMSQEYLANKAILDRTYISSCERGRRNISLLNIYKIAEALEVNPSKLLRGIDIIEPEREN